MTGRPRVRTWCGSLRAFRCIARRGALAAVIAAACVTSVARAAGTPEPACLKTATAQAAMNACADRWLVAAQARLTAELARARTRFGAAAVNASELAWVSYRNAECRLQAGRYAGGSIYPLVTLTCWEALTDARTAQLERDLSAPR